MRLTSHLAIVACSLLISSPCEAGGLFRRVPEVGEWARYESTLVVTHQMGKPSEHTHEQRGSLLLKCVGEEIIDNQRHLWIEWRHESKTVDSDVDGHWSVMKVFVPEEGLAGGTVSAESVRGWRWSSDGEVEPLDFTPGSPTEPYWPEVSFFLGPDPPATTGRMDERTIVVNEVEVQLTYAETAPQPSREIGIDVQTGEITWWPDADLAFGIAALDYTFENESDEGAHDMHGHGTINLIATGTDAVSELPDHN